MSRDGVRPLVAEDARVFLEIRREALALEPLAFLASPEDDVAADEAAVRERLSRAPENVVFGAFDAALVGMVGVYREPKTKAAHRIHVWGMYVRPTHRGRGLGRALLDAAVAHARSMPGVVQVHLGATTAAPGARGLYERAGFRCWGTEPRYLGHGGRWVDCEHFVLDLDGPEVGGAP